MKYVNDAALVETMRKALTESFLSEFRDCAYNILLMNEHPYVERYRAVWEATLSSGELSTEQVHKSRYYFEDDVSQPVPRDFDTFGVVALMPMPQEVQTLFSDLWTGIMQSLDQPMAYAVEPQNRHIELILFSRPEEIFPDDVISRNIQTSFQAIQANPPKSFKIAFASPFITPDGTVVVPGFPLPSYVIDGFRAHVREATNGTIPEQQSKWLHVSLGRILEPIESTRLSSTLSELESKWGKLVVTLTVNELYWTHEKQWYMVKKDILHSLALSAWV